LDQLATVGRAFDGYDQGPVIRPYLLAGSYLRQEILRGAKLKRPARRRFTGSDHTAPDIDRGNRAARRRNRRWALHACGGTAGAGIWLSSLGDESDGKP